MKNEIATKPVELVLLGAVLQRFVQTALVVLLLAGCVAPERQLETAIPPYVTLPSGGDPADPERLATVARQYEGGLIAALETRFGRPLQILEISGGAQNGAFGAGVLAGWTESGSRPKFDIVTGISVGALLATHAFLGEPRDDAVLEEIFANINKDSIYTEGGLFRVAFGGSSLLDSAPLADLLAKYMTQEVFERVAAEAEKGRLLAVGA